MDSGLVGQGAPLPREIVDLATVAVIVGINFVVFRNGIFHAKSEPAEQVQKCPQR
jgi:hypothetical protein